MGKAKIMSYIGDGKYSILYMRDNSWAKLRIEELETLKLKLDEDYYNRMLGMKTTADLNYAGASQKFFWALDDWAACAMQVPACDQHGALMAAVKERAKERTSAASAVTIINGHIAKNRADHYSAIQEIGFISSTSQTTQDGVVIDAWCISHDTEQVIPNNTTVGTIETYGAVGDAKGGWLPKKYINVETCDLPDYSCAEHNRVQPASSMGSASWAMNYMQWLYVMANNPKFAVGKITALNTATNTASVVMYGTTPSSYAPEKWPFQNGGYEVNIVNVPVEYLDCNARAFSVNDKVIIRFNSTGRVGPKVIGFAEEPKECRYALIYQAGQGGSISGEQEQLLNVGQFGSPVTAVPDACKKFSTWSPDGGTNATRSDQLVAKADQTYQASFAPNDEIPEAIWIRVHAKDRSGYPYTRILQGYGNYDFVTANYYFQSQWTCGSGQPYIDYTVGEYKYWAYEPTYTVTAPYTTYSSTPLALSCWDVLEFDFADNGHTLVYDPGGSIGSVVHTIGSVQIVSGWSYVGFTPNYISTDYGNTTATVSTVAGCAEYYTQVYSGSVLTDKSTTAGFYEAVKPLIPTEITIRKKTDNTEITYYLNDAGAGQASGPSGTSLVVCYTKTPP